MHLLLKITEDLLFIKVDLKQKAANSPFEGPSKLQIVVSYNRFYSLLPNR